MGTGTGDLDFAVATVTALWPGSRASLRRGWAAGQHRSCSYLLLPSADRIRVIAPSAPRRVAAAGLAPNSAPVTLRQRAVREAGRWGLLLGLGGLAPHQLEVTPADPPEPSIQDLLAGLLGQPVQLTIGLGTARANRKPVLRVLDSTGRNTIAFAKVGVTDFTRSLVQREAESLRRLQEHRWRAFSCPEVIGFEDFNSCTVLLMSALPRRGTTGMPDPVDRRALIEELSAAFGVRDDAVRGGDFVEGLRRRLAHADTDPLVGRLGHALDAFELQFAGHHQRLGAWHGDFTPWNMMSVGGRTWLWDWEQFALDVPTGLDELHYCVNSVTHRRGFTQESILSGLDVATWPQADHEEARMARAAYLAIICTRYVTASRQQGGEVIIPEGDAALAALGTVLGLSGDDGGGT